MLLLPEKGFQPSMTTHNVRLEVLSDWIESSVVFACTPISASDVIDILQENGIYRDQDFAKEIVKDAWTELDRRRRSVDDGVPFELQRGSIRCIAKWTDTPSYSFCLMLSLLKWSPSWFHLTKGDYQIHGELFERMTAESLEALGWRVFHTGWTHTRVNSLREKVQSIADHLNEPIIPRQVGRWTRPAAKDVGLDVVCEYPFADGAGGRPLYLIQCATGQNWRTKIGTPNLSVWCKLIDFSNSPIQGFALPFCLDIDDFRQTCCTVNGLMLDRYRLVDGEPGWESSALAKELIRWTREQVKKLPAY